MTQTSENRSGPVCGSASNPLGELLMPLIKKDLYSASPVPGVTFMRASCSVPRSQVVYEPNVVIIGQGRKVAHIDGKTYVYDPMNYLVLAAPMPFECETIVTPGEPLLGFKIYVDPLVLGELLMEMEDAPPASGVPFGMGSTALTPELTDAAVRLLRCMGSPAECRVLGPQIVCEILYRVLCGPQSASLRAVAARHTHFAQINKALQRIHDGFADSLDVQTLARDANMSVSAFHHNFKAVTSTSPLRYLKSIRLHRARLLMVQEGASASAAAARVGYESPSQFSREFKRFFGASPVEEAAKVRAAMV